MKNPNMIGDRHAVNMRDRTTHLSRGVLLKRLWKYLGRQRMLLIVAVLLSVTSSVLSLYGPKLSGIAINAIDLKTGSVDLDTIINCVWKMAVCYVISAGLTYFLNFVMIRLSRRVSKQMRHDIFENMSRLPVRFFDGYQTGDLISIITYDIDTVNQSLSTDMVQILNSIVTVVVSMGMMLSIAPKLMLIFVIMVPITFFATKWLTGIVRPLFRNRSAKLGKLNGFVEEMLSGQKTIRAYGREDVVQETFNEKNQEAVEAYIKAESNGSITGPMINAINNITLAIVCIFGSLLFLGKQIGLGDLSSFVQYSRKFSGPINEFANIISELQSAFAASERVFFLIDAEPETADSPDAEVLKNVNGDVLLDHIDFSYTTEKQIIKDFSLHAKPGSLTAIVGPTGAGKTTIINLLMRFYDVDRGTILIDGKDILSITRDSLRKAYTMVLQDTWLFHGTIYENIAYGKPDATLDDVIRVCKAAHIHGYISRLPDGYDTVLTDNGTSISKGQKQLLTIARAMLLDAQMLILDEATSNVDTRTEQKIQAAMRKLMEGKTCFVIAHRLSTIRSADNILVMRDGSIVEQGNHDSLMSANGFYKKLYQSQFDVIA